MATPQEQYESMFSIAANELSNVPLENNPEITYGDVLSDDEINLGVYLFNDEVVRFARENQVYEPGYLEQVTNPDLEENPDFVNPFERARQYNIPPIDFNIADREPRWFRQSQLEQQMGPFSYPVVDERAARRFGILDDPEKLFLSNQPINLSPPRNLAREQEIAKWGIEPRNNEITFNDGSSIYNIFGDASKFAWHVAFAPRDMTVEDYEHIGKQFGLEGNFRYINPNKPELGVAFKREGTDNYQLMNTPGLSEQDIPTFIAQEAPALVGEIGMQALASRIPGLKAVLPTKTGFEGGIIGRTGKLTGMSTLLGIGAAGGDLVRLMIGSLMGAHDRDLDDLINEAGITGLWSMGGTTAISATAQVIPSLWRTITGKNVPPEYFEKLENAYRAATEGQTATTTGRVYGSGVSIQEINSQIDDLTDRFREYFVDEDGVKKYEPTLGAQAPSYNTADLELLFLKIADDPKLQELYQDIKLGNQDVIDAFTKVLSEKLGPDITTEAAGQVTGATTRRSINELAQTQVSTIKRQMEEVIDGLRTTLGGAEDAAIAGEGLFAKNINEEISNPLFERFRTTLVENVQAYKNYFNDNYQSALNNPKYTELRTGAGYTKPPTKEWLDVRKADADKLLGSIERDEAAGNLFDLTVGTDNATLRRLQGLDPTGNIVAKTGKPAVSGGRFQSPEFSLNELNNMRLSLNEFRTQTENLTAKRLAENLMYGIEDQMYKAVRDGAAEAAKKANNGVELTPSQLTKWMDENEWGGDLSKAWKEQGEAYELVRSDTIQSLLNTNRPEAVAQHLFNTTKKGTGVNTTVNDLMTVLKHESRTGDEVQKLQQGLAGYIRRTILDASGTTREKAVNYRNFINDHEGVLKAVFGEEGYAQRFNRGPRRFQERVLDPLDRLQGNIDLIRARFNLDPTETTGGLGDVINHILSAANNPNARRAGFLLEDVEYLADFVKDNPEVQEQVGIVTKRWIIDSLLGSRADLGAEGVFALDTRLLDNFINEGFGPKEITGPRLTFESLITPLLGDSGPEFIENLRYLNDIAQREIGAAPSGELVDRVMPPGTRTEYGRPGAEPMDGARFLSRMIIAPLSILGRRVTAISNRAAENAHTFIGHMLLDEELFNRTIQAAKRRTGAQQLIRYLTAHQITAVRDMGNQLKYYDTDDKTLDLPEEEDDDDDNFWTRAFQLQPFMQSPYSRRFLELQEALSDPEDRGMM